MAKAKKNNDKSVELDAEQLATLTRCLRAARDGDNSTAISLVKELSAAVEIPDVAVEEEK